MVYGLSDLHTAVISGQARRVLNILRENKEEIMDVGDIDGTTPLMTAVLTGRWTIARLLLQNGASARTRDHRGRKALVYSRASLFRNKLRLYRRLGLLPMVSHKQHRNRGLIAKVLRYPAALESCRRGRNHECSRAIFFKDGETLNVLRPDLKFKIAKECLERATAGFITSNTRPEVKIAAASGWQPNPSKGSNVLDNPKYLQLVQDFARVIRFKLIRSQRDNNGIHLPEHIGRFVASHTEKKLAVFWVIAALQAILNTTDLGRVHELREANIPAPWKEAWIFLDHTPCGNCWQFLRAIKQVTGIRIYLETRPFLLRGNRDAAAGCHNCPCDRCRRKFEAQPARDDKVGTEGRGDGTEEESGTSDGEVPEGLAMASRGRV
ncbi:Serine/threonine-protein phosphatase 6 regulatory ankyrin repeat subunit C [Parachaetomium inaequale]|uniref:Serine/threonine-protein phosphatase 6 regulatory ankyrin repeat subunit C n=1 Tax=Parachaetomium inaequale TaxID=2588326 RepID=A0AAN6PAC2_9PEZI|nr:Serine/threonine-protein phosphatase 6 regulatory ankyrin repeat subunit C [Parachaetomium inaequale]